jgi:preprotein translocase subunit SecG
MTLLFIILIVIASVILSLIVLVQNPKGGGLAGNVAGFSNQFMGVKQTTDVLERGTWIFAAVIGLLCIMSSIFIPNSRHTKVQTPQTQSQPGGPTTPTRP